MNYTVIYGSVRQAREGDRVARLVEKTLIGQGHQVTLVDPKECNLPLLDKRYVDYEDGQRPEILERLAKTFQKSDGFVIVSGEYNSGIPPALKNLLDHFKADHFARRPAAIVTYSIGMYAGVRVLGHLRDWLSQFSLVLLPTPLAVGSMTKKISKDGEILDPSLEKFLNKTIDEILWASEKLKS
ncbi:MAG: NAD(P)H-dependent oxidoreductase [bacterium]|nr:NAD(P)H-dependent oxidoreductase [bacterium]